MNVLPANWNWRNSEITMNLSELFDRQQIKTPHEKAVVFENSNLTYSALQEKAERLSDIILSISPESSIIGLSTTRSMESIVAVLAILKAGKAYMPLDPAYPAERLRQMISDSGIDCCLALASEVSLFDALGKGLHVVPIDDFTGFPADSAKVIQGSLAYVLYTSGSTGRPKAVCMGQSPLINLLNWQSKHSLAGPGTRTLQFAPLSFDVSFQEIFATLTTGGTLYLIDDDLRLDPSRLLGFIQEKSINRLFLPFVALQYLTEAADALSYFPDCLQEVITAGEQLKITPQVVRFFTALPNCSLYNQYGPTECHVVTALKLEGAPKEWPALPSIGKPIDNTGILILDDLLEPLPQGQTGELCISGMALAEGYLNRPELTTEKFVEKHFGAAGKLRLYRTGDIARLMTDGNIELLGRKDEQVKIRGYRIELGEIEVFLNRQQGVQQAIVVAREDIPGQKKLVAYLVSSDAKKDTQLLRRAIEKELPEYMMPSAFVWLDELPQTSSGKVDRKNLPKPDMKRPDLAVLYKAPASESEKHIAALWTSILQVDRVGTNDNFFELGGNSLLALKTVAAAKLQFRYELPVTKIYQYPTVAGIARYLNGTDKKLAPAAKNSSSRSNTDVAIIAMAGRFPGANTISELWELLKKGKETVSFFSKEELDEYIPDETKADLDYVRARGIIDHAEEFDAAFFGINPKLAELMDPQQKIFMEIAWEALETAGYIPSRYNGIIGVYAGTGNNSYFLNNVLAHKELIDRVGSFQVMTANEKDYVASRTAYELNLKGPAVSVHSACSTSLLAISQAVESIRKGQCDLALAGGASITVPIRSGHIYQEGAMLSPDGHCRSFDAKAQGTVFSDGAGVVLLKSREAAEREGDTIYALIKGVGINNDGGGKGSFTAPNAEGQAGAISMAIADAGVDPLTISYVEAHGTATPVGDPIEMEGLNIAFGHPEKKQYCAIGSIKSNIGHLTAAAGVAGLIKTALALYHKEIPASINYDHPNPNIDFKNSPFFVNAELRKWETGTPRIAGVSSFGVGGTNVHVILQESSALEKKESPESSDPSRSLQLISWSAKTEKSRDAYAALLADFINSNPLENIDDIAFTLQTARGDFRARRFALVNGRRELIQKLNEKPAPYSDSKLISEAATDVVFLFPGQGSQYINMGRELYSKEPVFKNAVDECAVLLQEFMKEDIREIIFPAESGVESENRINNTYYTQPALFVIEYSLAKLWMSWGIRPAAFVGHSIGEFVAAHLAGVFSLKDGLLLIATRGRMMASLPGGSMLGVRAGQEKIMPILPEGLSLAAINSPVLSVVAGPVQAISDFSSILEKNNIPNKLLHTSHAFHSSMMDSIVEPFEQLTRTVILNIPRIPIVSTVTGKWMTDAEACDPGYWAKHLRATVRFSDALNTIFEEGFKLLLESGPRNVASTLARQNAGKLPIVAIASLDAAEGQSEQQSILRSLGNLWLQGLQPDWTGFYQGQHRKKIKLPTYAFDHSRYWVKPVRVAGSLSRGPVISGKKDHSADSEFDTGSANTKSQNHIMRKTVLIEKLKELLENASGIEMDSVTPDMNFIEIGFDSLLLTQVALNLKKEFGLPISFRQLNEEYGSLDLLAGYLDAHLPTRQYSAPAAGTAIVAGQAAAVNAPLAGNTAIDLINTQIQLLAQQVALLQQNGNGQAVHTAPASTLANQSKMPVAVKAPDISSEELVELKKPFGATARIEKHAQALNTKQQAFLDDLTRRYNARTRKSKEYTQEHRSYMADPRVVSGFRPLTKEIVYPVVVNASKGSRLWDIDGNEYIDVLNGFGSNLLGYQPEIITKAIKAQIEKGYELGPQHELAGPVCKLICEFTRFDRAALCNTGSEAVLGAMRIARTVTGRSTIVAFSGSYHGIVDEVIVRGTKKLKSFPAAPGIMPEAVQNMLILDYGTEESLQIIRSRAGELAAVLVEPVQSRRPEFRPVEFLKELRKITEESGTALIFDEVITGFRMHQAGTQGLFGITADLGTYGKVVAAGIPIGVIAGKKQFMDALDGGFWKFGDHSSPEAGVTYFAGTFVRHPMALAASKASLEYMKAKGPDLQQGLNELTGKLADALNVLCDKYGLPLFVAQFGSLWKFKFKEDIPYSELLFTLMREKGIHIWDGFPCFLTEAHTKEEVDTIVAKFDESIREMLEAGFFPNATHKTEMQSKYTVLAVPPVEGAKLGKDKDGNPAWFINDPSRPGKYLQVN